jgi:ketosteroid isomerase-like protein
MTDLAKESVPTGSAPRIAEILRRFVEGFNTNSLDEVMTFFAEDAVYEPGDGRTHRGRAAIREAFRPQFENAFGWYGTDTFHFDERGRITGKFSYANYGRRPHVRRDLGA